MGNPYQIEEHLLAAKSSKVATDIKSYKHNTFNFKSSFHVSTCNKVSKKKGILFCPWLQPLYVLFCRHTLSAFHEFNLQTESCHYKLHFLLQQIVCLGALDWQKGPDRI